MINNRSFNYYQDPGHGWVAVKFKVLEQLGLSASDFSGYSYLRGKTIYLEEDDDASKFVETWIEKFGQKPNFIHKHTDNRSPIRSYPSNF